MAAAVSIHGCGSGGYAGQALQSLSASSVTIDAGQSFSVTANNPDNLPLTWTLSGASCSGAVCGTLSTTSGLSEIYTAPAPLTAPMLVTLRATIAGTQSTKTVSITVNPAPTISGATPNGTVGTPYSATLTAANGTGALKLSLASGTLPAGLTFNAASGVISGTPTQTGASNFVVQVIDSSDVPNTVAVSRTITIGTATVALSASGNPPAGVVGTPYSSALQVTGGTAPYSWTVLSGGLPAGLTLSSGGTISGTPTATGSSTFTAQVQDASGAKASATFTIPVTGALSTGITLTTGTLPNGTVGTPYGSIVGVTGGTGPYTCSVVSGSLPNGLNFGAGCVVSGTPTVAGTSTPVVRATDSSNPAQSTTGPIKITINPSAAVIVISSPPPATTNTPYTGTIPVTGGTGPYTCALTGGTLPAGLSLNSNCQITGTPTTPGSTTVTVTATDSSNPTNTNSAPVTVTVNPGNSVLNLGTPPAATVNTPYMGIIPVSGGTGPYTCVQTGGTLPAGLTLGINCQIAGTPTTPGTTTVTVKVTDSSNPVNTTTGNVPVTVDAAVVTLTLGAPPVATINTPYTGNVPVAGGTAPYTCAQTGGTLQAGLTLGSNCQITGTPTVAGTNTITVKATDAANPGNTNTGSVPVTVNPVTATLSLGTPPAATVNTPYTGTIPVSGGTGPYTCAQTGGTLPAGLTLGANCQITGTPTTSGTTTVTIKATDSSNPVITTTADVPVTVNSAVVTLAFGTPPAATINTPYTGTIPVSGGTGPYTCIQTGGMLPTGLVLGASCQITGTPTVAGTAVVTVTATDSSNPANTNTGNVPVTVDPAPATLTLGAPPAATINTPYNGTIPVTGGTGPYTCVQAGGTLPAGLALNGNCQITGTPTTLGTTTVTVTATDSSNPANTNTGNVPVTVNPTGATLALGTPPAATINTPYTGTIPVSGGSGPYTCVQAGGTLPAGLTLNSACQITGTPTVAGTTNVSVTATDSSNPANTNTGNVAVTVNPAPVTLTLGAPPAGTVNTPYTGTIPVTGGTAPYTCVQAGGTLPAGLVLGSNCQITGTPTAAGTTTVTVTATDAGNPAHTNTGNVPVTINPVAAILTLGTPPAATINTPYTGLIPVAGGTAPYTCVQIGGALQAGLTLNSNCQITGTPTVAGTSTIVVKATDSANPTNTNTGNVPVTVNAPTVTLALGIPPAATVNTPYAGTIPVSGGNGPYTCAQTGGVLQAGLTLNSNCQITGTPTVAGTSTIVVKATDSSNPANTNTGNVPVTVNAATVTLTLGAPPAATINTPYTGLIPVSGGTGPYTCVQTGGTLQAGLALNSNCLITGTPTVSGTRTIVVKATDSSNPTNTNTGNVPVTVNPAAATLTIGNPPAATVNTPYTGTIPVTGGTAPYTCTVASGTLPAGLSLGAGCVLTGTPTTAGTTLVGITATDTANPVDTRTSPVTITVQGIPALTLTGSLPNAVVNQPYTQTLQAQGGVGPYTYAITAGALPAGLNLSTGGVISGTPTVVGATSFTVTATDSEGTPQQASLPLVLLVTYAPTPTDALLKGPYAYLFQGYDDVVLGVLAYQTSTIGSFNADGAGVLNTGELDSNHQGSNPAGNTIASHGMLGTYTVDATGRGTIAVTTLNSDGTTAATTTYAIALKPPVSPATAATSGSLIEFDSNQLAGTKGTGTLLAQTTTAFAAGLNGSYAFGLSGDTPCLPSCTVGILAGPVAEVGQFTAAGGTITGGTADTNIASENYANSTLSGSYQAADGNGRMQLTLNTSKLAGIFYPTDFAVYIVDANNAFVMSTDKHSAYIMQAGTARLQTQPTFNNTSLAVPFVGYENSPVNPGLVGQTLQNVLNISSATIFRGTGNGNGTCTTTNVDVGGTTGLVNTLTGLGGNALLLNALLGTYQALGNSNCAVEANGRVVYDFPRSNNIISPILTLLGFTGAPPAPRVVYMVSPSNGYFLETGYAGLGRIEAQVPPANGFTLGTLNGMFVYSTVPASTLATINSSGVFTADGNGHTTSTLDENVGVGTLNLLQLGVSGAANYSLTDATAGRYLLGTSRVIYAIAPGRFVLLETDLLSTTPYIALLD